MPCLLVILALLVPRVALALIWLFSNWFALAFRSVIWPLLGFIFMPYTTLAFMGAMVSAGALTGGWLVVLIAAVVVDVSHLGFARRKRVV